MPLRLTKAAVTIALVAGLVWWVDVEAMVGAVREARTGPIAAALLLLPVNLALDGWVWGRMARPIAGRLSPSTLARAVLAGFALGFFTPARIGEYAGRAFAIPQADRWTLSVSIFAQRMVDFAIAVNAGALALAGALVMGFLPPTVPWIAALGLGLSLGIAWSGLLVRPDLAYAGVRRLLPNRPAVHARTAFLQELRPADRRAVAAGSGVRYLVYTGQMVLLIGAFLPDTAVAARFGVVALLFFVKFLLPAVTLMDLGVREGAAVLFFTMAGWPPAAGLNAALLLFAINLVLPSCAGVPFLWNLSISGSVTAPASDPPNRTAPPTSPPPS